MSEHWQTYPLTTKRHRHPCDKWGRQPELARLVFLTIRKALHDPIRPHPDSKRTRRAKQEGRERHQRKTQERKFLRILQIV